MVASRITIRLFLLFFFLSIIFALVPLLIFSQTENDVVFRLDKISSGFSVNIVSMLDGKTVGVFNYTDPVGTEIIVPENSLPILVFFLPNNESLVETFFDERLKKTFFENGTQVYEVDYDLDGIPEIKITRYTVQHTGTTTETQPSYSVFMNFSLISIIDYKVDFQLIDLRINKTILDTKSFLGPAHFDLLVKDGEFLQPDFLTGLAIRYNGVLYRFNDSNHVRMFEEESKCRVNFYFESGNDNKFDDAWIVAEILVCTPEETTTTTQPVQQPFFRLIYPLNNSIITSRNLIISWETRDPIIANLTLYGPKGILRHVALYGNEFKVKVEGLEPGESYHFDINVNGTTFGPYYFTVEPSIGFSLSPIEVFIKQDYGQIVPLTLENNFGEKKTVYLSFQSNYSDVFGSFIGPGGDEPLVIGAGESAEVLLSLNAPYSPPLFLKRNITVIDAETNETITVIPVQIVVLSKKPVFNAVLENNGYYGVLRVTNNGTTTINNLTVTPINNTPPKIVLEPHPSQLRLAPGETVSFKVLPVLYKGYTGVSGKIVVSAGNVSVPLQYNFVLPPGKDLVEITPTNLVNVAPYDYVEGWPTLNPDNTVVRPILFGGQYPIAFVQVVLSTFFNVDGKKILINHVPVEFNVYGTLYNGTFVNKTDVGWSRNNGLAVVNLAMVPGNYTYRARVYGASEWSFERSFSVPGNQYINLVDTDNVVIELWNGSTYTGEQDIEIKLVAGVDDLYAATRLKVYPPCENMDECAVVALFSTENGTEGVRFGVRSGNYFLIDARGLYSLEYSLTLLVFTPTDIMVQHNNITIGFWKDGSLLDTGSLPINSTSLTPHPDGRLIVFGEKSFVYEREMPGWRADIAYYLKDNTTNEVLLGIMVQSLRSSGTIDVLVDGSLQKTLEWGMTRIAIINTTLPDDSNHTLTLRFHDQQGNIVQETSINITLTTTIDPAPFNEYIGPIAGFLGNAGLTVGGLYAACLGGCATGLFFDIISLVGSSNGMDIAQGIISLGLDLGFCLGFATELGAVVCAVSIFSSLDQLGDSLCDLMRCLNMPNIPILCGLPVYQPTPGPPSIPPFLPPIPPTPPPPPPWYPSPPAPQLPPYYEPPEKPPDDYEVWPPIYPPGYGGGGGSGGGSGSGGSGGSGSSGGSGGGAGGGYLSCDYMCERALNLTRECSLSGDPYTCGLAERFVSFCYSCILSNSTMPNGLVLVSVSPRNTISTENYLPLRIDLVSNYNGRVLGSWYYTDIGGARPLGYFIPGVDTSLYLLNATSKLQLFNPGHVGITENYELIVHYYPMPGLLLANNPEQAIKNYIGNITLNSGPDLFVAGGTIRVTEDDLLGFQVGNKGHLARFITVEVIIDGEKAYEGIIYGLGSLQLRNVWVIVPGIYNASNAMIRVSVAGERNPVDNIVVFSPRKRSNIPPTIELLVHIVEEKQYTVKAEIVAYDPDGNITATSIAMGDGTIYTGVKEVQHTYLGPGTYTIKAIVVDNKGGRATAQQYISFNPPQLGETQTTTTHITATTTITLTNTTTTTTKPTTTRTTITQTTTTTSTKTQATTKPTTTPTETTTTTQGKPGKQNNTTIIIGAIIIVAIVAGAMATLIWKRRR